MTTSTYKSMSETATGRKELHTILINEITAKTAALVAGAPEANRKQAQAMVDMFIDKCQNLGNGTLFNYFCMEGIKPQHFLGYMQDVLKGKIFA